MIGRRVIASLAICLIFFALAAAVYFVPLSERPLTFVSTATSQSVGTRTLFSTEHVTSTVWEVSPVTISTFLDGETTVLDKGYRVGIAGDEFDYFPIKDLRTGDRINVEVQYPYKIWVKLVDPKGRSVIDEFFDGGDFRKSATVEVEGKYTLWVETLVAPGLGVIKVKVTVARPIPTLYVTTNTIEKKQVIPQTQKIVSAFTQTATVESRHTTSTKAPLESRIVLTPALIIVGLATLVAAALAGRRTTRPLEAVYCINCGNPLSPRDKYCEKCGAAQPQ